MGVGGRLGAGWGQTQRPAPKTRSVNAVHSQRERRRSDTEGPRPKFPHNEEQARAIPAGEVQPHPANDSTRTEPPGAVQPRHRHRSGRAARDDSEKNNLCVTRAKPAYFQARQQDARPGGPQRRRTPGRDSGRGPPKAARQDGRNVNRRGVEPGRMEPEGPRLENMPMNRREADAAAKCGQHKPRYIPTWNVKLYKIIDNSIKMIYI